MKAASRSRVIESAISCCCTGERSKTTPARMPAARKPAPAKTAENGPLGAARGTRTAPSRQIADAARSASEGESASQSTCGVGIEAATITATASDEDETAGAAGNRWSLIEAGHDGEREQDRDERDEQRQLAEAEVERLLAHRRAALAVQHGRDQPQRVHGGEHDRGGADGGVAPALREDAGEDRELARRS